MWSSEVLNDERIPNLASNSNRVTFDPHFGQEKELKNWQNTWFSQYSTVFGQKGDQMLFDSNFRPDLEYSHHLASCRTHLLLFSHFEFFLCYFWSCCYFLSFRMLLFGHKCGRGPHFFLEKVNSMSSSLLTLKMHQIAGETVRFQKRCTSRATLMA